MKLPRTSTCSDAAAGAPAREPALRLKVVCPGCSTGKLIPWDRLDSFLFCRACSQWYRLDRSGRLLRTPHPSKLRVEVRSSFSGWESAGVSLSDDGAVAAPRRFRDGVFARPSMARLALGAALLLAVGGAACLIPARNARTAAPATDAPLPAELEPRAQALTVAWLGHDTRQMLRFIAPGQDRQLRLWCTRNAPQEGLSVRAEIGVTSIVERDPTLREITVRIAGAGEFGERSETLVKQFWNRRGDQWDFVPWVPAAGARR